MNDPVLVGYEDFLWCLVMSCERGTSFGTGTTQFRCNLLSQETCRKSVEGASVFREVSMLRRQVHACITSTVQQTFMYSHMLRVPVCNFSR